MNTVFIRALEAEDKAATLLHAIKNPSEVAGCSRFEVAPEKFSNVPSSPFAYWVSSSILNKFVEMQALQTEIRKACFGLSTKDDYRFLRLFGEAPFTSPTVEWFNFVKGGSFSTYYFDCHLLINWDRKGRQIKAFADQRTFELFGNASWSRWINNWDKYFRAGLTWPRRSQRGISLRVMPSGCIFADKGPAIFLDIDGVSPLLALLAITNSRAFRALVELQMAFGSYEVGVIQRTPIPEVSPADEKVLSNFAHRAWSLKRSLDTINETSHAFLLPAFLQVTGSTIGDLAIVWGGRKSEAEVELERIQAEIDDRCFDLYSIHADDRRRIEQGFGAGMAEGEAETGAEDDAEGTEVSMADVITLTIGLISWMVGAVYGRFDLRLARGERPSSAEPEPFDPLPVCSPGMLADESGQPITRLPKGYPLEVEWSGILVDDPGHPDDVLTRIRQVFDVIWQDRSHNIYAEATEILDPGKDDLRPWFRANFFADHIKRYSKSRRKAPIYWCLTTPSRSYSVWLYYHRFDKDTFYKVLNDYVTPKLQLEERKLSSLRGDIGATPTTSQRKLLADQEKFVEELTTFRDEIAMVAPLWNPNLNDGVIINYSPLWRLVPLPASWQKECKQTWDTLVKGEYDWAHLSMRLWPERVIPKCHKDRSLAIAHGLESALWEIDADGKWQPREVSGQELDALIEARSSLTVRDARDRLLAATVVGGGGRRRQRG